MYSNEITHIALQQPEKPDAVLLDHGSIEAVLLAEELDSIDVGSLALRLELGDVGGSDSRRVAAGWMMKTRMLIASRVGIMISTRRIRNVSIAATPGVGRACALRCYPSRHFDRDAGGGVDPPEERRGSRFLEIFVGCLARPLVGAIVVDDQHPFGYEARMEVDELMIG